MKIKRIVFTPLLENGKPAVRPPTKGEWFQFPDGATGVEHSGHAHVPYPILARTEEEVEVPDPPVVYGWVEKAFLDFAHTPSLSIKEMVNRHAAEVSPAKLCGLVLAFAEFGSAAHEEATRLLAAWRKK